jgi:O-antigen ligase
VNPPVNDLLSRFRQSFDGPQQLFMAFIAVLLLGGSAAVLLNMPALLLPAALAVGLLVALIEWRWIYYLLFFVLPFTEEIGLFGGLSMDVPSEPLMLVLTGCVGAAFLLGAAQLPRREWLHPLIVLLALMLLWTAVDAFF